METIHDFSDSLAISHKASDLPLWEELYRGAFPSFQSMVDHRQDGEHQRAGIDRSVILSNSKQILVDEKVRGRNKKTGKVYDDIALEYAHVGQYNAPGWVCKPLRADYIAYAIAPLGVGYLFPVIQLQSAWKINESEWRKKFPCIESRNPTYTTLSLCIPPRILGVALVNQLKIGFSPCEV